MLVAGESHKSGRYHVVSTEDLVLKTYSWKKLKKYIKAGEVVNYRGDKSLGSLFGLVPFEGFVESQVGVTFFYAKDSSARLNIWCGHILYEIGSDRIWIPAFVDDVLHIYNIYSGMVLPIEEAFIHAEDISLNRLKKRMLLDRG